MHSSIIDNQGENTLYQALQQITQHGHELWVATAFFSLDALNMLGERLDQCSNVRLIFGDDAAPSQRQKLLEALRERSQTDLLQRRDTDPLLRGLQYAKKLIEEKRLESRVYTKDKFHAKAYLAHCDGHPQLNGILGSGNFTRPGLTQNIELNVHLTIDQTVQLKEWFEEVWEVAEPDVVTDVLFDEILRHTRLYNPRAIFLKALFDWGQWIRGENLPLPGRMPEVLDPHQLHAVREGLRILEDYRALMICDGVGLGKSFVALALMEEALLKGQNVALIAPKAIMDASWKALIEQHLRQHRRGIRPLELFTMPDFQYPPQGTEDEEARLLQRYTEANDIRRWEQRAIKLEDFETYSGQIDLLIVDESHNFRSAGSARYRNLLRLLAQARDRKGARTVLMTATPVNTGYADVTNQFRLLSNRSGTVDRDDRSSLAHTPLAAAIREANALDAKLREQRRATTTKVAIQARFDFIEELVTNPQSIIRDVLQKIAIQRSRATCQQQALDAGVPLRFPSRVGPVLQKYDLSPGYETLIKKTEEEFTSLAKTLRDYFHAILAASQKSAKHVDRRSVKLPDDGLRFSAYLLDLYLKPNQRDKEGEANLADANSEAFLASLVFANVMKQLESSPAAYVSILRSLGASLIARLVTAFPDDDAVAALKEHHAQWVNRNVREDAAPIEDDLEEQDPVAIDDEDAAKDEVEALPEPKAEVKRNRIENQLRSKSLQRAMAHFSPITHNVLLWRGHLENDLRRLEELHKRAVFTLQNHEDNKLKDFAGRLREFMERNERVLVFTQSVLTADYLSDHLPTLLPGKTIERIDGRIQGGLRASRLHRFAPLYNAPPPDMEPDLPVIDVLIATDVLSEGVNLQQAGAIINYDIHWNPTRLIQRVGRVDRRLRDDDEDRSFTIVNCFPPKAIEDIIQLVRTVEGRVGAINAVTGIDQAFFKSEDEAGTLKEFNAMIDGTVDARQELLSLFETARVPESELPNVDREELNAAKDIPRGAFGVWEGCGHEGMFGLFKLEIIGQPPLAQREQVQHLENRPVLVMKRGGKWVHNPVEILHFLSKTVSGEPSGTPPPDDAETLRMMRTMKQAAVDAIEGTLPQIVVPRLVVWLELRP